MHAVVSSVCACTMQRTTLGTTTEVAEPETREVAAAWQGVPVSVRFWHLGVARVGGRGRPSVFGRGTGAS